MQRAGYAIMQYPLQIQFIVKNSQTEWFILSRREFNPWLILETFVFTRFKNTYDNEIKIHRKIHLNYKEVFIGTRGWVIIIICTAYL